MTPQQSATQEPTTHPGIPDTLTTLAHPIDQLQPYDRNPRRGNIDTIAESLATNGQYRPVVANRRTHQVLAGNHTLQAARRLGWTHIAVTWVDVDDEAAARIVLVDNRANDLAGYDDTELAALLQALPDFSGTGYDQGDLDELLATLDAQAGPVRKTDPDHIPDFTSTPISRKGDVWQLGPHRLVVGDGTNPAVVAEALDGGTADAYVTDPPYNVDYTGGTAERLTIENDAIGPEEFEALLGGLFAAALEHTKPGGPAYIFHADSAGQEFRTTFASTGWLVLDSCAGSGSMVIACHGSSRRAAVVELDPKYADVICRRYQEHTGTTPVRDGEPVDFTQPAADPAAGEAGEAAS